MDLVEAYAAAAARNGELIAAFGADQLESSTPCKTWTARALINHIVGGQYMFAGAASGAPLPGLADRMAELPFGTVPAAMVPGIACFEQVVHGWDLARATGQDPAMPAAVVSVPGGAPTIDRLVALTGRRP